MERQTTVKGVPWCFEGGTNLDVCQARGSEICENRPNCLWGQDIEVAKGLGESDRRGVMDGDVPRLRE
ncbi:TPA: hypothetical protein DCQ19_02265 [Candidatus Shapirobacteria bacterium]|nr:hypothetical protein [Candidatus Shapirobacteria bacterium]